MKIVSVVSNQSFMAGKSVAGQPKRVTITGIVVLTLVLLIAGCSVTDLLNTGNAEKAELQKLWFSASKNSVLDTDVSATLNGTTFEVKLPHGVEDISNLKASFTASDEATVTIGDVPQQSGVTANNFTTDVIYTITSKDGKTIKTYTVKVTVAEEMGTEAKLTLFRFLASENSVLSTNVSGTLSGTTFEVKLPHGVDISNLKASFTASDEATVTIDNVPQQSGVTANNFTTDVIYTITSQDGKTKNTYTVKVTVAEEMGTEAKLTLFRFLASENSVLDMDITGIIDDDAGTVSVVVPAGTEISNLVADYSVSLGAQTSGGGNDFSNEVDYTIQSQDEKINRQYRIVVKQEKQPDPPVNVYVTQSDGTGTTVNVTWEAPLALGTINGKPAESISKYRVYWGLAFGNSQTPLFMDTADGSATGLPVNDLIPGENYVFTVTAFNDSPLSPESVYSIHRSVIPRQDEKPLAPKELEIVQTLENEVQVLWKTVKTDTGLKNGIAGEVNGYTVYYRQGPTVSIADGTTLTVNSGVSVKIDSLKANTEYTFAVLVRTSAGDSELSAPKTVNIAEETGTEAKLTLFRFLASENSVLDMDITGIIDDDAGAVSVVVPAGTGITNLVADYSVSLGAQTSGGGNDFSNEVVYTIQSQGWRK